MTKLTVADISNEGRRFDYALRKGLTATIEQHPIYDFDPLLILAGVDDNGVSFDVGLTRQQVKMLIDLLLTHSEISQQEEIQP